MSAFFISLGVIFMAEIGDKSQLTVVALAARFKAPTVLAGIAIAAALVQAVSVTVGAVLGSSIPEGPITIAAAVAFLGFAVWTLRGEGEEDRGEPRPRRWAILTIAATFFLAELGDKTMLATVALATRDPGLVGTWAGATAGMIAADGLAIVAGGLLLRHLPDRVLRVGSALTFAVFGLILLVQGISASR